MGRHTKPHAGRLFQPTEDQRRQVLMMVGFGIRQEEVCFSLQIDKKTLHKHFRRELDTGMTEANVRVAQALYTNAVKHNSVAAQIWWTKARMGWKDTSVIENNGNTNPVTLHLIAAQTVSQELQRQLETQRQTPPTINGELDKLQPQPSWLDAPPPEE